MDKETIIKDKSVSTEEKIEENKIFRINDNPYERRLKSDFVVEKQPELRDKISPRLQTTLKTLPKASLQKTGSVSPNWNSVALFFNLRGTKPADYNNITGNIGKAWLDEGQTPANPKISDFFCNYWHTVSYGNLAFGIDTPSHRHGLAFVPNLQTPNDDPYDWFGLIKEYLEINAEPVWNTAKRQMLNGKRWIPSVVLVHNYFMVAQAGFGGFDMTVDGIDYIIGDVTHLPYYIDFKNDMADVPINTVRSFWGSLAHEYCHNFLEFGDLYGPQGCVGYWDLLGSNSPGGRMSEISSPMKERVGWLSFKEIIKGPQFSSREFSLRPYTTTGEAIKIIPDEQNNPHEFFTLEYRKSTGDELWRPDRALQEEGLLINHFNTRMGISPSWLLRDAPYLDAEFADFSDNGSAKWTGHDELNGVLYPHSGNDRFTPASSPNSNFYGQRSSGLYITNIRIEEGQCKFTVSISGETRIGWEVSDADRCLAGNFTKEAVTENGGQEIFCRNDNSAALLTERQAQWLVVKKQTGTIGNWSLGRDDREIVGDFDGDGFDEIYVRSPQWAGILKWSYNSFDSVTVQYDNIGEWKFGENDRELAGDFDGDGIDEILVRSDDHIGIFKLVNNQLKLIYIESRSVGNWQLGESDTEYIGRFSQRDRDEILIRNQHNLGLLYWDTAQQKLRVKQIHYDRVADWRFGADDKLTIGDFEGDRFDEIYIRSANWAGFIKWSEGFFTLRWIKENELERWDGNIGMKIPLKADDISYAGRFRTERDCVLHRASEEIAVLVWNGGRMVVSDFHHRGKWLGSWSLGASDKYVIGDFHRLGPDIGDPLEDFITDGISDVFTHNSWGTGMFGINPRHNEEIVNVWINPKNLLFED